MAIVLTLGAGFATSAHAATVAVDAADTVSDVDGCGGGPAAAADPCKSIQAGIAAASAGDTVRVAAAPGGYAGPITVATAGLTIAGPRATIPGYDRVHPASLGTEAVVSCPHGSVTICVNVTANGVRVTGLALRDTEAGTMINVAADDVVVVNNQLEDGNPGVQVAGDRTTVSGNAFYGNPLAGYRWAGGVRSNVLVEDLRVESNLFYGVPNDAVLSNGGARRVSVVDNVVVPADGATGAGFSVGGAQDLQVTGNALLHTSGGIVVWRVQSALIAGNLVVEDEGTAVLVDGGSAAEPYDSADLLIRGNALLDNGNPTLGSPNGAIVVAPHALNGAVSVTHNRIAGNRFDAATWGLHNGDAGKTVNAADNWWGCNEGPQGDDCDWVGGNVTAPTWLTLRLQADQPSPGKPGNVALTARLDRNNVGQAVADAAGMPLFPVAFAKKSGPGAFVDAPDALVAGVGHATFSSSERGTSRVAAGVDFEDVDVDLDFGAIASSAGAGAVTVAPAGTSPLTNVATVPPRVTRPPSPPVGPSPAVYAAALRAGVTAGARDLGRLGLTRLRGRGRFVVRDVVVPAAGRLVAELTTPAAGRLVTLARGTTIVPAAGDHGVSAKLTRRGRSHLSTRRRAVAAKLTLRLVTADGQRFAASAPVRLRP